MKGFRALSVATAVATYALVVLGGVVRVSGSGLGCPDWPLCHGRVLPPLDLHAIIEYSHRTAASLTSTLVVLTAAVAWMAWRNRRDLVVPAALQLLHRGVAAVIGLLVVMSLLSVLARHRRQPAVRATVALTLAALAFQVAVGAAVVTLHLPAVLRGLHLALASAVWSGTVILAVIASRLPPLEQPLGIGDASRSAGRPVRDVVLDYISLAKPRIIPLLLITALGGMMMAERGWPSTGLVLLTLLGGALAAAGAGAINCWIDRDLDREMMRTRRRPLPDGRIAPSHALIFGLGLGLAAFLVLAFWVNVLAATLAISGLLFYVFVYTLWLKRWTVQNLVIGGAAGAVPPMVGWAAVTHRLDLTALYLFAIIFLWTPPHFWALALRLKGDYARAQLPMLPVVRGESAARRQILFYTLFLVAVTLAVVLHGALGILYLAGAGVLGGLFIALAVANLRTRRQRWSRLLFDYSIAYLGLLFAVMVADRMIGRL